MTDCVRVTVEAPTATMWLDRPDKRNAITAAMWRDIPRLVDEVASMRDVAVLVVRGRGDHFCAGADIAGLGRSLARDDDMVPYRSLNEAAERSLAAAPLPTVAAIDGACIGGGVQLALACDIRVATARSRFGVTPAKLGITYPARSLERLVATVGAPMARRLLLTAELVDAAAALRCGLVTEVVADDGLDEAVVGLTAALAAASPVTQLAAKQMIDEAVRDGAVADATAARWEARAAAAGDLDAGLAAFAARTTPRFSPRAIPRADDPSTP